MGRQWSATHQGDSPAELNSHEVEGVDLHIVLLFCAIAVQPKASSQMIHKRCIISQSPCPPWRCQYEVGECGVWYRLRIRTAVKCVSTVEELESSQGTGNGDDQLNTGG